MELKIHDQEILLQKLWKSKKLFEQTLHTTTGQKVEVVYPGTENLDTGPDFKDAIIKLEGRLIKGDVEIHLDESGWYSHGHHTDPRYNNVVLHLVSEPPGEKKQIEREDGVQIHQLCVNIESQKEELWKTPTSESIKKEKSLLIIQDCPLSSKETSVILTTVQEAGIRRLYEKVEQVREELKSASWDQILYKKILEALGYSKNQIPFRKLAELVPYKLVCSEMQWVPEEMATKKCAALLFGAAGLLPSLSKTKKETIDSDGLDYIAPLEYLWEQMSHRLEVKAMKSQAWQFFRLRPQNFPTRRIAGMVAVIRRFYKSGLLNGLLKIFYGHANDHKKIKVELESVLVVKVEGFWSRHFRFEDSAQKEGQQKKAALIGKDRARDIAVNIIFPTLYLYSIESQDGKLKNTIKEIYLSYPKLAENTVSSAMKNQLLKYHIQNSRRFKSACIQQGLIHLHKLYCKPLKCSECLNISELN